MVDTVRYFAELDENNIVTAVFSAGEGFDGETIWEAQTGNKYKETSITGSFRKNYAGVGYIFDEVRDAFIFPQPFDSWTLNEETCRYEPPSSRPLDGKPYTWNEETTSWDEASE